jgi:hypothetical protein
MDRRFLQRWSQEWAIAYDPERDRPLDEDVRAGWLGFEPATEDELAEAEARLGRRLPPSLRSFLAITNGWRDAGNFIYRIAGATELDWLRDTNDAHWARAYRSEVVARSLRLSLKGDSSVVFLDPMDFNEDGEWAAYRLASWSGTGPERFDSFADLMYDLYADFHALRKPPGETRDALDVEVEQARRSALSGELDAPAAVFEHAQRFGHVRAAALRFQLFAMQDDWYTAPLSHLLMNKELVHDPLFEAEVLPLLWVEERRTRHFAQSMLDDLRRRFPDTNERINRFLQQRAAEGFRQSFGNPEFDALVRAIVDDLPMPTTGEPVDDGAAYVVLYSSAPPADISRLARAATAHTNGERARRAAMDAAWPRLLAAMSAWRPVSDLHLAPVVLFTDIRLAELITPSRGRELLRLPRG